MPGRQKTRRQNAGSEFEILIRMVVRGNTKKKPTNKKKIRKGNIKKKSPEAVERSLQALEKLKIIIRNASQFWLHPRWWNHVPLDWWKHLPPDWWDWLRRP